jgi:predicted GNAT family N-acyltransferase
VASSAPPTDVKDNEYLSRPADGSPAGAHESPVEAGPACDKLSYVDTRQADTTLNFEIRRLRTQEEFDAALALRYDVFCVEQGVPRSEERDGRDHGAVHLVAVQDGEIVATCRLVFVGTTVQFSRLAVRASARRQGIAAALLQMTDTETRARGANRIVLHAQTYARPLYDQAGYVPRGREFVEAEIEHIAMEKLL